MTSKQEKLAAARRKLKEFQGKNKEGDVSRHKVDSKIPKQYFYTPTPNSENESITHSYQPNKTTGEIAPERKISGSSTNSSHLAELWTDQSNRTVCTPDKMQGGSDSDCVNGLKSDCNESHENSFTTIECAKVKPMEPKQYFRNENCFNDMIKPLQTELQNHAQTITILVQQRNDAQNALAEIQNLLTAKSGEAEELKQEIANLSATANSLSQRLSDAEDVIMKLKLEKEDNLQKQDELRSIADRIQAQLSAQEEKCQELKKKYEEKNSNCQQLLYSLQETQSQLSLCQIQLQQYTGKGHSGLVIQVSELQNENLNLKQNIEELNKKLDAETAEKDESSQKFHIYAQQCNSQLSSLNDQLKSLKLENETLSQKNNILSKNLSELECAGDKKSFESFRKEIADLHNQLSALSETNNQILKDLKRKAEECTRLEKEISAKESEINKLLGEFKKLEEENKRLLNEAEVPKANERLLATLESDKVAAAKAVSQNMKLKEQVVELENAFVKLSEEKLELTNQLAHEKHVTAGLQNLLKKSEHHECHQESLVNDSDEIEELRNIVRQLQDDKMELTARLNSYEGSKIVSNEKKECGDEHEESQCESTKLLLQQMEEKVKKTMNEIAILDEEKEKLEHLVLQLQGETETIGEYVALYQKQRMLLNQRAKEKDVQLQQLSKDKEELKSKLAALDELVQHLIPTKANENVQTNVISQNPSDKTAEKILALIREIGSTTLIDDQSIAFEHCPCCSGRLINI